MPDPADRPLEDIARTEARFRLVNDRIAETVDGGARSRAIGFICECGDPGCQRLIDLTQEEWGAVRDVPRQFVVVPGHELPRAEAVIARVEERYVVVLKPLDVAQVLDDVASGEG